MAFQRGLQAGRLGVFPPPPEKRDIFGLGSPSFTPFEDVSRGARGGQGRSPTGQASLPREQEAEPRPADLLLEVRGQGRPSRPHFLQPRPTPCGPRVYGNSGLDGFSEIIRSVCPHFTPPARRRTQASVQRGAGKEGTPSQGAQVRPLPQHFFFRLGFQGSGSKFSDSPA